MLLWRPLLLKVRWSMAKLNPVTRVLKSRYIVHSGTLLVLLYCLVKSFGRIVWMGEPPRLTVVLISPAQIRVKD